MSPKHKKTLLTLDCSTTCTGWAFGTSGEDLTYGAIWQPKTSHYIERTYHIIHQIVALVEQLKPDIIVYEEYVSIGRRKSAHVVPELLGALKYALYPRHLENIHPHTWRAILGIKRKGNQDWKTVNRRWIQQNYKPLKKVYNNLKKKLSAPSHDVYDAVSIFFAALSRAQRKR